ncbi:MAG: thymidylate synthase [Acidimicrobiales bacterium]|nr:thymidylate synthase [Acidimicrobiales bacterium]
MSYPYVAESFEEDERSVLRRYFTNLDKPVFALVNLPEVVKGALFARYSRSSKSLRRLFLDEFVDDLDISGDLTIDATMGLKRAESLYEKVFVEYGDDSVAQLGGVHLACEQASNILTKILEWGRIMSYLEQSTRYIAYDARLSNGHYRYYRDPSILDSPLGARYVGDMDRIFDSYGEMLPKMVAAISRLYPKKDSDSEIAWRSAVRAKALDSIRGLLPAASLSNVGIYGSGQSFENLLLRMRSHPLEEARLYSDMMLGELRKVIPSFLARVDRQERGGLWSEYMAQTRDNLLSLTEVMLPRGTKSAQSGVELTEFDPKGEISVASAALYPYSDRSMDDIRSQVESLDLVALRDIFMALVGDRSNRRHRPGRAFEATNYTFDIISDYGAFRDLQRHRLLTLDWQALDVSLGWDVPTLVTEAKLADEFNSTMERSLELCEALKDDFEHQSQYAIALGFKIRYKMTMNAREAMHIIELRSSPQGHPSYRKIAQEMHRQIADVAGHHLIAGSMNYVDYSDPELERLESEERILKKRNQSAAGHIS